MEGDPGDGHPGRARFGPQAQADAVFQRDGPGRDQQQVVQGLADRAQACEERIQEGLIAQEHPRQIPSQDVVVVQGLWGGAGGQVQQRDPGSQVAQEELRPVGGPGAPEAQATHSGLPGESLEQVRVGEGELGHGHPPQGQKGASPAGRRRRGPGRQLARRGQLQVHRCSRPLDQRIPGRDLQGPGQEHEGDAGHEGRAPTGRP